jgi:hypothetical protein
MTFNYCSSNDEATKVRAHESRKFGIAGRVTPPSNGFINP